MTENTPETKRKCFECGKPLKEGWCKDIFGYYYCDRCYWGEEEDGG